MTNDKKKTGLSKPNNGWTAISPDGSNLPKQTEQRFVVIDNSENKFLILTYDCSYVGVMNKFEFEGATHYRPKENLKPPLW